MVDISQLVKLISASQWFAAGQVMAKTIENPWTCLTDPHVSAAYYGDLKYLCYQLIKGTDLAKSFDDLQGINELVLRKSSTALNEAADSLKAQVKANASRHMTNTHQLGGIFKANVTMSSDNTSYILDMKIAEQERYLVSLGVDIGDALLQSTWPTAINHFLNLCEKYVNESQQSRFERKDFNDMGTKETIDKMSANARKAAQEDADAGERDKHLDV